MNAEERLLEFGYEGIKYLTDYSYDSALIGVSDDGRAIYDYGLMIEWLMEEESLSIEDAVDWVEYNTLRSLSYFGSDAPIVMYKLPDVD